MLADFIISRLGLASRDGYLEVTVVCLQSVHDLRCLFAEGHARSKILQL